MNARFRFHKLAWLLACLLLPLLASVAHGHGYTNLSIAVYFRYQEVHSIPTDLDRFSNQWANVEKQVKVAKVYLETTRNAQLATESDRSEEHTSELQSLR